MLSDLADGVAKLGAEGVVDPKRVCVVGASFGGYLALAKGHQQAVTTLADAIANELKALNAGQTASCSPRA